jgi:peroxiredoxin
MKRVFLILLLAAGWTPRPAAASPSYDAAFAAQIKTIQSRLQSMGHGYYARKEWNDLFYELDLMADEAERQGRPEYLVQINLLTAMIHADMFKDYDRAASILVSTKEKYSKLSDPVMRRVYGQLAGVYARQGNDAAIQKLIQEFKASPAYDPEDYGFQGGWGREVPLVLTRPSAGLNESITVTTMRTARERAVLAPGNRMPDFQVVTTDGRTARISDFRGRVLLVDFWVSAWEVWRRELPYLRSTYARYRPQGFEVLGVCMDRDATTARDFIRASRMDWPQVVGNTEVPRQLRIFGEATNFLLDRDGVIVGRDLKGAELVEAIKRSL